MLNRNRQDNKRISLLSGFVLGAAALVCCFSTAPAAGAEKPALQALVVTTTDWSSVDVILRRLRPEANPLLIQLPQQEYERMRAPRGLP